MAHTFRDGDGIPFELVPKLLVESFRGASSTADVTIVAADDATEGDNLEFVVESRSELGADAVVKEILMECEYGRIILLVTE
jgi:hypothetical protein